MNKKLPSVTILAAVDDMFGIGLRGGLPWHNPRDLAFFKRTTENQVVIMGRKTWESLPKKPLPNRINYVISGAFGGYFKDDMCLDTFWIDNPIDALWKADRDYHGKEIFIIGGHQLYKSAIQLGVVDTVILSHIHGIFDVDTYFPPLKNTVAYYWREYTSDNFAGMTRVTYQKTDK